ncbi:MAG: phosphoribosylformylglycinamidine cyclo-ligase [Dictyoglomus turgidum]
MFWKEDGKKRKGKAITYSLSGVSINKVERALEEVKGYIVSTYKPYVFNYWNSFASVIKIPFQEYKNPLIITSTDGVGTKLIIALKHNRLDTIGDDLLAMNVNDILTAGAKPLIFMDYFAGSKIDPEVYKRVIISIANACKKVDCSLVGGETAEMPGIYRGKEIDLVGFVVGIVEEENLLPKMDRIKEGNVLIGVASSGLHSNGYSLVRYILRKKRISLKKKIDGYDLLEEILRPTKIYPPVFLPLLEKYRDNILGIAHITGGGIPGNLPRILPKNIQAEIDSSSWDIPWIFKFFIKKGNLTWKEAFRVFNMGIGLILIVSGRAEEILIDLKDLGEKAYIIGELNKGERGVKIAWKENVLEF